VARAQEPGQAAPRLAGDNRDRAAALTRPVRPRGAVDISAFGASPARQLDARAGV
jgi:hypothetical protein